MKFLKIIKQLAESDWQLEYSPAEIENFREVLINNVDDIKGLFGDQYRNLVHTSSLDNDSVISALEQIRDDENMKNDFKDSKNLFGENIVNAAIKIFDAKSKPGSTPLEESAVDKALSKKAKASGISKSILKQVYSKGARAWKSGHRPGVAQQQWAMGRLNSFITGKGGARKADAKLWKKVKKRK
jgi:hypothetical protein